MFDRVLNMPLPGKEKIYKHAWIMTIDRQALPKTIHVCSDHVLYPFLIPNGKASRKSMPSNIEASNTETLVFRRVKASLLKNLLKTNLLTNAKKEAL